MDELVRILERRAREGDTSAAASLLVMQARADPGVRRGLLQRLATAIAFRPREVMYSIVPQPESMSKDATRQVAFRDKLDGLARVELVRPKGDDGRGWVFNTGICLPGYGAQHQVPARIRIVGFEFNRLRMGRAWWVPADDASEQAIRKVKRPLSRNRILLIRWDLPGDRAVPGEQVVIDARLSTR